MTRCFLVTLQAMSHLVGNIEVVVLKASNLPNLDYSKYRPNDLSDPYVSVKIVSQNHDRKIGRTPTIKDCLNPEWNFFTKSLLNEDVESILFEVFDQDFLKVDKIGFCNVHVNTFVHAGDSGFQRKLENDEGEHVGHLYMQIKFSGTSSISSFKNTARKSKLTGCYRKSHRSTNKIQAFTPECEFLHGNMLIKISSAQNLPNLDCTLFNKNNKSDPFVSASLIDWNKQAWKVAETRCIQNNLNPFWNETFSINVCHEITGMIFEVFDQDLLSRDKIGTVTISVDRISGSTEVAGKFDILNKNRIYGKLDISILYENMAIKEFEVPNCLFPSRSNNIVRLYQDAHCSSKGNDAVKTNTTVNKAWHDIYQSLQNASRFILITGWSVKASIRLIRDRNDSGQTLGEILNSKASKGVDVRLLIWDEVTSTGISPEGAMSTWESETEKFFSKSKVKVSLDFRRKKTKALKEVKYFSECFYTHHQKSIIVDSSNINGGTDQPLHLVTYIGGLDLTCGRYDTPDHPLFNTLVDVHKRDFYNKTVKTTASSGPRQPWHDVHSQVIGPAAKDILANFMQRWTKKQKWRHSTLKMDGIDLDYQCEAETSWNVQIFRSITEDSVNFVQGTPKGSLITKDGKKIDDSIHRAYIHHIQKSQKFIYIENQYFIGSSHRWDGCRDITVKNLIPVEIALKIVQKIRLHERFVAYIVIPMYPEGNPEDAITQELLHWQFHTIEMMYKMIRSAISQAGIKADPQDYLLFFCIGKREGANSVPDQLTQPVDKRACLAFQNRRSMIYVHSKMAIFDDEYILVGSANINDRSLIGTRDTEIAMGAYQPKNDVGNVCDIANFRKSLWAEHLGAEAPITLDPRSLECARKVRQIATETMRRFLDLSAPLPECHLILYPFELLPDGMATNYENWEYFPDSKASVFGLRSRILPSVVTT